MKLGSASRLGALFAVLLGALSIDAARADLLYVTNLGDNTIGEYTTAGAAVNPALVLGLNQPLGIALSGADLFVANLAAGTIGEYNATTGAAVNPALITGLIQPFGIALSGGDLFVANFLRTLAPAPSAYTTPPPARW